MSTSDSHPTRAGRPNRLDTPGAPTVGARRSATPTVPAPGIEGSSDGSSDRGIDHDATLDASSPASAGRTALAPGARIGRYVVERVLGQGGMGIVHAAHDPELGRTVAVKLLASTPGRAVDSAGRMRLLREAQALAQLSHPNVVSIFDVGRHGDDVFLAMEYVDGPSLKRWLASEAPPQPRILAMLIEAGRGLAAAHAKGLVHRDVKPDNIFVWRDGRVAIGDFGLARSENEPDETSDAASSGPIHEDLTHTGAVMGTPPYMAPEQHLGHPADARSDQFGFCVTAWEALTGERPFPGVTIAELRRAILEDGPVAGGRPLPRRIERVLRRGLAREPEARWPSMDTLLAQLAPRPQRWPLLAAGAAGVALLAAVVIAATGDDAAVCPDPAEKLAPVWNPQVRAELRRAFAAADVDYADSAASQVIEHIDGWSARFGEAYRDACRATRVRREYDESVLALRNACLDRRLTELRGLVDVLKAPDAALIRGAVDAVDGLRPPADCSDVAALTAAAPLPTDPAARARIAALDARVAELRALAAAGQQQRALALADELTATTEDLGYRPLEAEVRGLRGALLRYEGRYDQAEAALRDAVYRAEAGRADEIAADAWIDLMLVARDRADFPAADERRQRARAALERLGDPPVLLADHHSAVASVHAERGEWDAAARAHRDALAALGDDTGAPRSRATALHGLGLVAYRQGRLDEALSWYRQALALRERTLGTDHPEVAVTLLAVCATEEARGAFEEALASYERALAILEGAYGPDHIRVAEAVTTIGGTLHALGRHADALAYNQRALDIRSARQGPDHADAAQNLTNMAIALKNLGRHDEAVQRYQQALAIYQRTYGPAHFTVGIVENNLAEALRTGGEPAAALEHYRRALDILAADHDADNPILAHPLTGIGEARLALGDARAAVEPLQRALALRSAGDGNPVDLAQTRFALARALWQTGARGRARQLAAQARDGYQQLGPGRAADAAAVARWLAKPR